MRSIMNLRCPRETWSYQRCWRRWTPEESRGPPLWSIYNRRPGPIWANHHRAAPAHTHVHTRTSTKMHTHTCKHSGNIIPYRQCANDTW